MIRLRRLQPDTARSIRHWGIELAVVVVGVLLALWAAQWADDRRLEREDARILRDVQAEVHENRLAMTLIAMQEPCIDRRIRSIVTRLLDEGEQWEGIGDDPLVIAQSAQQPMLALYWHPIQTDQLDRASAQGTLERSSDGAALREMLTSFKLYAEALATFRDEALQLIPLTHAGPLTRDRRLEFLALIGANETRMLELRNHRAFILQALPEGWQALPPARVQYFEDRAFDYVRRTRGDCILDIDPQAPPELTVEQ